jgi:CheY-like chemotaxis protein
LDCEIIRAENGARAVELADRTTFDVILMDLKMPSLNGIEATKQLRANGIETPIISQSANAFGNEVKEALAAGCNDYMTKPLSRDIIVEKLNKFCKLN